MRKITASFRSTRQHAIVGISSLLACYILVQTRHDMAPLHSWNRAFADVSLFMLALVLILSPLSHFHKPLQKQIVWRRPIGIWSAIHAGLHTVIILLVGSNGTWSGCSLFSPRQDNHGYCTQVLHLPTRLAYLL